MLNSIIVNMQRKLKWNHQKLANKMVINTNHLVSTFRNASYDIKYKLFKTFAMPLYGYVLWDYSSVYIEK